MVQRQRCLQWKSGSSNRALSDQINGQQPVLRSGAANPFGMGGCCGGGYVGEQGEGGEVIRLRSDFCPWFCWLFCFVFETRAWNIFFCVGEMRDLW